MKILYIFVLLFFTQCAEQKVTQATIKEVKDLKFAFYNVENLFDTVDDEGDGDDKYAPNGEKEWDQERYQTKLTHVNKVLKKVGQGSLPTLIGVCEIENEKVIQDLISSSKASNYSYVHKDSPDKRGIDVGLIYDSNIVKKEQVAFLKVNLPAPFHKLTTRDILYFKGNISGESFHLFVNHWSSRHGGKDETSPKREACAAIVKTQIDKILAQDKNAKIVLMGDFNDEPHDKSIQQILAAKSNLKASTNNSLYNLSASINNPSVGTYNYKGNWNMLDQIIVSGNWLNSEKGLHTSNTGFHIVKEEWMLFNHPEFGWTPSRTYGGPKYHGGYSDHLPVYIDVKFAPN